MLNSEAMTTNSASRSEPDSDSASSSAQRKRLVVVGNGIVGHSLCKRLIDAKANEVYEITVFGDEPRPAYDRVNLTDYLRGRSAEELELSSRGWYENNQIALCTGQRVEAIDRAKRIVKTNQGQTVSYDTLVFATGARPFVPPIDGVQEEGVFLYRTIEDLDNIRAYSESSRTAAVLGGGLLGLEAAKALYDLSLATHVVDVAPALMPRQLDNQGATVLREFIEGLGVQVHLTKRTERIVRENGKLVLQFDHGEPLQVDMIVISAGIRPRDELGRSCGLQVGERGGIEVDDELRTSDPGIYAIGECASHRGRVYGLAGPGHQMAETLASLLTNPDDTHRFVQGDQSCRLKLMDVSVATMGEALGEAEEGRFLTFEDEGVYRKLILLRSRLVGAMGVGDWPEQERIRQAIEVNQYIWPWQIRRFQLRGRVWSENSVHSVCDWPKTATVCSCMGVSRGDLTSIIDCKEHCTVTCLAADTGASTVCGSCKPLLEELVGGASPSKSGGQLAILLSSIVAVAMVVALVIIGPVPVAASVQTIWRTLDLFWEDFFWKQVTGYTLLGITAVGLLLSLRKRLKFFTLGDYQWWRIVHTVLGCVTLIGLLAHTGIRLGSNLTFALGLTFIGVNLVGGFTGIVTALETRNRGALGMLARQWRQRVTDLHIWLFWPLPILILFHVISVYYY